ncbi:hypothetical protein GCM10010191_44100 [Actinomadura vinacea]|uniref:Uncharacterized protein n=1 Tax=Actinomadura vinacea TaxID=115336 RepID=A0ABN3JCZ9_9ACTN
MVAAVHDQDPQAQFGRAALGDGQAEEAGSGHYKINVHEAIPGDDDGGRSRSHPGTRSRAVPGGPPGRAPDRPVAVPVRDRKGDGR